MSYAQTTFYLDTDSGAGFGTNPSSFLWNTTFATNWTTDATGNSGQVAWTNTAPGNNAVLGNGSGNSTSTAFLGGNIDVGTISVVLGTWTISLGSNTLSFNSATNSNLDVTVSGSGSVVKNGAGIMTVTTTSNYTGGTTISGGALRFTASNTTIGPATVNTGGSLQIGVSNALPSATSVTLAGGTLGVTGAFSQSFSTALSMSSSSTIDFGGGFGTTAIVFGDSSGQTWTGTLTITNYNIASGDTLRFGTSNNALTGAQLSAISFDGLAAQIDASGFVTPVPEPATVGLLIGAGALGFVAYRRRRLPLEGLSVR